jgi:hypothetical protein
MDDSKIRRITEPVKEFGPLEQSVYLLEVPEHPLHFKMTRYFGTGCNHTRGAAIKLQAISSISNLLSRYITFVSASM